MRMFKNCVEAVNEIKREIHEMGILVHPYSMQNKIVKDDKNYSTKEVRAYSFAIIDQQDKNKIVNFQNLTWCRAEFNERISMNFKNPGKAYKLRDKIWSTFLRAGSFDYTYNERICWQLDEIISELKENPDSRQCIIEVHDRNKDHSRMRKQRIPCSMYYQLLIREGRLDIIYNMRSSDYYNHFKNDIWLAIELRNYIANEVKVPRGLFFMFVGSLHMYKNYGEGEHVF